MSAQTIRDVLIKIAIESSTRGFRAPDFRKVQAEADAAKKSVDELAASVSKVGKGGYGGTGPGGGAGARTRGATKPGWTPGNATGTFGPFQQLGQPAQSVIFQRDELTLTRDASRRLYQERNLKTQQEEAKRTQQLIELENQRSEALNGVAMGLLKVARGSAFVLASGTEEYQAMLKWIAAAQGYFDLASGGIDIYKNLNNLKKAATAATLAEAAAETTLAGARSKSAVAGAASTGRGGGLGIVGSLSRVALPIAAAYGVGKVLQHGIGEYSGSNRLARDDAYRQQMTEARNARSSEIIESSQYEIDARFRGQFEAPYSERAARRSAHVSLGLMSPEQARAQILSDARTRNDTFAQMRQQMQKGDARTSFYETAKENLSQADFNVQDHRELLQYLEREADVLKTQADRSQSLLRTNQQLLQVEQDRYSSGQERFGRLDPAKQARALAISRQVKSGATLDRSKVAILEDSGIDLSGVGRKFFLEQATKGGFDEATANIGGDAGLRQAQQAARHASDVARETNSEVTSAFQAMTKGQRETGLLLLDLIRDFQKAQQEMQDALRRQEQLQRETTAGSVKASGSTLSGFRGGP